MHESVLIEIGKNIKKEDIAGKNVLELGSRNVNGSIRGYIEYLGAASYTGIDFIDGVGVDLVTDVCNFKPSTQYDVVISTEMLEHVENWKIVVKAIKDSCKMDGMIIISTRGPGMVYHGYPHDYWRFTKQDIEKIFSNFKILHLIEDWQLPGIIMIAKKIDNTTEGFDEIHLQSAPPPPPSPSLLMRKKHDYHLLIGAIRQFFKISYDIF